MTTTSPQSALGAAARRPAAPAREALDRTMLLMRDHLVPMLPDDVLLEALCRARVLLVADAGTLASAAGQTALVTTALMLLRSGTTVVVSAPDVALVVPQPPLVDELIVSALVDVGADLIEGVRCGRADNAAAPYEGGGLQAGNYDAIVVLGDAPVPAVALRRQALVIHLGADAVTGRITSALSGVPRRRATTSGPWNPTLGVPFGALAAAGLAAAEVFKLVMRSLAAHAATPDIFATLFAVSETASLSLDPDGEVSMTALEALSDLGSIDVVSGGAIAQSFLYSLARVPGGRAHVRVIEPENADASNLNRYALLRRSALGVSKATTLAVMGLGGLRVTPVVTRYDRSTPAAIGGLAPAVVVGVDHIPTRWAAQKGRPRWLGVGATSHYSAMSSDHLRDTPCTWCLHPADAPDIGPIPTVAFVSHWAGLLLAWRFVRYRLGLGVVLAAQYDFVTPLRTDLPHARWRSPVASRPDCPNRCMRGQHAAA